MNESVGATRSAASQGFLRRFSLWALIISVCTSALFAIAVILLGRFGPLEERILGTTLTIALASLCGLSCGALLESRGRHPLAPAGMALTFLAAGLVIAGIWAENASSLYWRWTATASVLAIGSAHLALLSLARLAPRFRPVLPVAWAVVLATAAILIRMIFGDRLPESWERALGVCAVLTAAVTVVIPVLHRLSREEVSRTPGEIEEEIARLRARIARLEEEKARRAPEAGSAPGP